MPDLAVTDLGECGAFVGQEHRCHGRLIVQRELGGLLEAECDVCGNTAAAPVRKATAEPESEADKWWDR